MTKWRGGSRATGKCARGHALIPGNLVKAGKSNNPRCRICRAKINAASFKRRQKRKKAEAAK